MFKPSQVDNEEVYNCYVKAKEKMQEAAASMLELKALLENKFMAISEADGKILKNEFTNIGSASWCINVQRYKIKEARAQSRIMIPCDKILTD